MAIRKKKISELTLSDSLTGLYTIGVKLINGVQTSVKVSLGIIQTAYDNMLKVTQDAITATKNAITATGNANAATSNANTATGNANKATQNANNQANRAKQYADNPPKMGENGNWYKWNEAKQAYEDTGILAKGGVLYPVFSIKPETMELEMYYQDEVAADMFAIDENGNLTFNPK